MIKVIQPYFNFNDSRGSIVGLSNDIKWEELNQITSEAGAIRGGHYHKKAVELFSIIEGEVFVEARKVDDEGKLFGDKESRNFAKGDTFLIEPMTTHTFSCRTDSVWIKALSVKMGQEESIYTPIS